jgi:feruloyl esterase
MNRRTIAFASVLGAICVAKLPAQSCEGLAKLSSPTTSILSTKSVAAGGFAPAAGDRAIESLPPFCRVVMELKPTADSDIGVEVWLPIANGNGKYMAVVSGGWGGSIAYEAMAEALRRGYATSATDDGHKGSNGSFVRSESTGRCIKRKKDSKDRSVMRTCRAGTESQRAPMAIDNLVAHP